MRHSPGEPAHGFELLRLAELRLQTLPLGYVAHDGLYPPVFQTAHADFHF